MSLSSGDLGADAGKKAPISLVTMRNKAPVSAMFVSEVV